MAYTCCCVYSVETLDDGQRNCPKHVEFYSKNKLEKLVNLVGFIIIRSFVCAEFILVRDYYKAETSKDELFARRRGTNPDWFEIFRIRPDRPWGPPSFPCNGYHVLLPGVKQLGRGVGHPPQSGTEVKERAWIYLCSLSGPSGPVLERTVRLLFFMGPVISSPN